MAWHIPISTSQGGTVVTMADGDDLFVDEDVLIASTGTTSSDITVVGTIGLRITIEGTVLSGNARAINVGGAFGALNNNSILVKAGGEVGSFETHAIASVGGGASITNHGHIHGEGMGILLSGNVASATGSIVNSGIIEGVDGGIARSSALSSEKIVLRNSGMIKSESGAAYGLFGTAPGRDEIINTGRMIGDILLGTSGDSYNGASGRLTGDVFAFAGNDIIIGGVDGNVFWGGIGADTLTGNGGNDSLNGDAGADKLNGGLGKDTLTGGADADRFIFSAKTHSVVGANADRITDFDDGNTGDRIDVSAMFPTTMIYRHSLAFTAAGQVRINDIAGADVIVEVNTGGTLAADFSIRLAGTTLASMNAGDFVL